MTPGIALLVIGGILLVSGWKGGSIADAFMGTFPDKRNDSDDSNATGTDAIPGVAPVSDHGLQLPARFTPTHETSGLPGFPAVDVFAKPGTKVLSPVNGEIYKVSGQQGGPGGGGPYGWNAYIRGENGHNYFLTHFGELLVKVGTKVRRGSVLGTVADYPDRPDHIHEGRQ